MVDPLRVAPVLDVSFRAHVLDFHDLRRFRATQWVTRGVDLRTVKELLGHADIKTTMRYAHFAPSHAVSAVRAAQQSEEEELSSGRKTGAQNNGLERESL